MIGSIRPPYPQAPAGRAGISRLRLMNLTVCNRKLHGCGDWRSALRNQGLDDKRGYCSKHSSVEAGF
jgi:hypothetical protein